MMETEMRAILDGVARAWNDGDPVASAAFFHADAVYEEPPRRQFYRGRDSILAFFRKVMDGDPPLSMTWRNLAFDPGSSVAFGEYTFARLKQFHGIVVVQFKDGTIHRWREYQYQSDLPWGEFAGESAFATVEEGTGRSGPQGSRPRDQDHHADRGRPGKGSPGNLEPAP